MKTNTISSTVTAVITADNKLVITLPLNAQPKLTKNQKSYVVAETGTWPQNWVTVDVDGESVGLTVCALIKNPEHPDNKPQPVVTAPVPAFFKKGGKPGSNGKSRIMPASVA